MNENFIEGFEKTSGVLATVGRKIGQGVGKVRTLLKKPIAKAGKMPKAKPMPFRSGNPNPLARARV